MIEINKKGLIISGRYRGWTVLVQDDSASTGGFLILLQKNSEGYDDWVADAETLEKYFQESKWEITWEK